MNFEFQKLTLAELLARRKAMQAWVGAWKDRTDLPDTETYIRQLRDGSRRQKSGARLALCT
jgi:hypothetical protein